MKFKLFIGLAVAVACGFIASNASAQQVNVAPASEQIASQPCPECEECAEAGFGGFGGVGVGRFGGFGGVGVGGLRGAGSLSDRFDSLRGAGRPIVEASPFANPNGSMQDWNRFRYYPYGYYPHNFSETPNMSVPKYHPGYQNYYPVPRRYHEGAHFHLDVF